MSQQEPPPAEDVPDPFSREGASWSPPPEASSPPPPAPPPPTPPPRSLPPQYYDPRPGSGSDFGPAGYPAGPPTHPQATPALVLGLVGLVLSLVYGLGGLVGIVGIVLGRRATRAIDGDPAGWTGRSRAQAGVVTGAIGLGVAALWVAILVLSSLR